jgi:hypothetical protein
MKIAWAASGSEARSSVNRCISTSNGADSENNRRLIGLSISGLGSFLSTTELSELTARLAPADGPPPPLNETMRDLGLAVDPDEERNDDIEVYARRI